MNQKNKVREDGFYHVKELGKWIVAYYLGGCTHPWFIAGENRAFGEHYWDEIDERRIVREEPTE